MNKPVPPVKPVEKLPVVYLLTVARDSERESGWWNVVIVKMQGPNVLGRRVVQPAEPSVDRALDEFNRVATRVFYFGEGEELCAP